MNKHRIRPLYRELASAIQSRTSCLTEPINQFGLDIHERTIKVCEDLLPSGSGWDSGTTTDCDKSHANKLVLFGSFHHITDAGYYDGWTGHTIIVTPSLTSDFGLRISGRNRNDIKDYLYQTFDCALRQDITYALLADRFPQFNIESKWENEDGTPSQCYQAFYVQPDPNDYSTVTRFWNNWKDAESYAADLMEQAFYPALQAK